MLERLGMLARGFASGAKAGATGSFMRSAAGARGYLAGARAGAWARTPTGIGTLGGAAAGGLWGAVSDDTSVLGGMAMGAGLGAVGGRYGFSAARRARLGYRGIGTGMVGGTQGALHVTASPAGFQGALIGAGKGIRNRFLSDVRGVRMAASQPINRVSSTLKGWGAGMAPL